MNREKLLLLDFFGPMTYFWFYRVRDNRPLEGSSGVVSQPYGELVSEPAGAGISPIRRFIQSQAYIMKQSFLVYLISGLLLVDLLKVDPKG